MKTQNLLGRDFCQKQVSGIHFGLTGIALKEPQILCVMEAFIRINRSLSFRKS